MTRFRSFLLLLVLLVAAYCAFRIYAIEREKRQIKEDLVELSKIKYGLFNVDEWKNIMATILSKKVEEINFNPEQKAEMRIKINQFLIKLLEDFEKSFNRDSDLVERIVADLANIFYRLKENIPVFTDDIIDFLSEEENREKVKSFILNKLSEYADKTFAKTDYTLHNQILAKYEYGDRAQTIVGLASENDRLNQLEQIWLIIGGSLLVICFLLLVAPFTPSRFELTVQTGICLVFLATGLLLPMIEIDARIEEMSFSLLGEEVSFKDQVLYYKSKSILEVVSLMLSQNKVNVYIVGFLVLTFSVLFPIAKLLTSMLYLYTPSLQTHSIVRFLVFRTGKWSMADVMVVAIFMSYIGFSGILTEQLNQLDNLSQKIDILTTNKSSLQIGFFSFTAFALISLLISHKIQFRNHN